MYLDTRDLQEQIDNFELENDNYFEVGRAAKVKLLEEANELLGGVDFLDEQVKIIDVFEEN